MDDACAKLLAFIGVPFDLTLEQLGTIAKTVDPDFECTYEYISTLDSGICVQIVELLQKELI